MAALKVNPDNSITLPWPLVAIMVTLLIACGSWANSLRGDVADLKSWKVEHTKQAADNLAEIKAGMRQTNDLVTATAAASTKQNAELQETLTTLRIQTARYIR
jgi:hypothetical protein